MKNTFAIYFKILFPFFHRKGEFSLLNMACVLLVLSIAVATLVCGNAMQNGFKEGKIIYHDLPYLKPFTSLVGFNWKSRKLSKQTNKDIKPIATDFLIPHLKPF